MGRLMAGVVIAVLAVWMSGCSDSDRSAEFRMQAAGDAVSPEDVSTTVELLESPAFLDRLRERLEFPRSSDVGGSVDIKSIRVETKNGSPVVRLHVEPDVQQPPAPSGQKWFVLKQGEQKEFRLEFPYSEFFQAVAEEFDSAQRDAACRLLDEKMEALYKTRCRLEEMHKDARGKLDFLRQEYGMFPPDNQTETMRQVRLLEQNRMDLSVKIKAAQDLQRDKSETSSNPPAAQVLSDMNRLLEATEQELKSANHRAKEELGALGEVEHLQQRIESLAEQLSAVESEMNQVRSTSIAPQIKLSLLH